MTNEEKIESLAEVFENPDINAETSLDTLQWDSMAMLSVMALVKANGKSVSGQVIREMKTVGDIMAVL